MTKNPCNPSYSHNKIINTSLQAIFMCFPTTRTTLTLVANYIKRFKLLRKHGKIVDLLDHFFGPPFFKLLLSHLVAINIIFSHNPP